VKSSKNHLGAALEPGHLAEILEPVSLGELRRVSLEEPVGLVEQYQQSAAAVTFEPGPHPGPHDLVAGPTTSFGLAHGNDRTVEVAQQQIPYSVGGLPSGADVGRGQLDVNGDPLWLTLERDLGVAQQGRLAESAATENDLGAVRVENRIALFGATVEHLRCDQ
jgi:hypothetical protein